MAFLSLRGQGHPALLASIDHSFLAIENSPRFSGQTTLAARGQFIGLCQILAMA